MVIPSNRTLIVAALSVATIFLFIFIGLAHASSKPDLLLEAQKATWAAKKDMCAKIGDHFAGCYHGDKSECNLYLSGADEYQKQFAQDSKECAGFPQDFPTGSLPR